MRERPRVAMVRGEVHESWLDPISRERMRAETAARRVIAPMKSTRRSLVRHDGGGDAETLIFGGVVSVRRTETATKATRQRGV
jgi:hypothetical protein